MEESLRLPAADLARADGSAGDVRWSRGDAIAWRRRGDLVELTYTATAPGHPRRDVRESVQLERLPRPAGGYVWGFRCPLIVNGERCGRRVLHLYQPPGGVLFGCRTCHRLTYWSSRHERNPLRLYFDALTREANQWTRGAS